MLNTCKQRVDALLNCISKYPAILAQSPFLQDTASLCEDCETVKIRIASAVLDAPNPLDVPATYRAWTLEQPPHKATFAT